MQPVVGDVEIIGIPIMKAAESFEMISDEDFRISFLSNVSYNARYVKIDGMIFWFAEFIIFIDIGRWNSQHNNRLLRQTFELINKLI